MMWTQPKRWLPIELYPRQEQAGRLQPAAKRRARSRFARGHRCSARRHARTVDRRRDLPPPGFTRRPAGHFNADGLRRDVSVMLDLKEKDHAI